MLVSVSEVVVDVDVEVEVEAADEGVELSIDDISKGPLTVNGSIESKVDDPETPNAPCSRS